MARKITDYDGQVNPVDSDYPDGDLKDNSGSNNGTKINRKSNSDIHQFFMKIMRLTGITPNGIADNEYSGFQLVDAADTLYGQQRPIFVKDGVGAGLVCDSGYQPSVIIKSTALASHGFSLQRPTGTAIGKVYAYNYSPFSVNVVVVTGGDTINSAPSPYTLPALTAIEFTFSLAGTNWAISNTYHLSN